MSIQSSRHGKPLFVFLIVLGITLFNMKLLSKEHRVKLTLKKTAEFKLKDDVFGRLRDGAENSKGEVFLLDSKRYRVFRFSREGELIDSFGQKGEGPGDLKNPFSLMVFGDDDIAVECFPYRLSLFKPEGAFYRLFNLNAVDNRISRAHTIGPNRWCVVRKEDNHKLSMVVCDFTGEIQGNSLSTIPDPTFQNSGVILNYREEATTPAFLFSHYGDFSACARNDVYSISILDEKGQLVRTFALPINQQKLKQKEIEYIELRVRKSMDRISRRPGMKKVVDNAVKQILDRLPSEKVTISSLVLSKTHLFVQRIADDISQSDASMSVDVFELMGSYLGRVRMMEWPLFSGEDAFYFIEEDNEGGTHVNKMLYEILNGKG